MYPTPEARSCDRTGRGRTQTTWRKRVMWFTRTVHLFTAGKTTKHQKHGLVQPRHKTIDQPIRGTQHPGRRLNKKLQTSLCRPQHDRLIFYRLGRGLQINPPRAGLRNGHITGKAASGIHPRSVFQIQISTRGCCPFQPNHLGSA